MSNITSGQHRKNLELLEQQGVDSELYQTLLPYLGVLYDSAAELPSLDAFRVALKLGVAVPETIRLSVDYSQTLEMMIAAGHYDWTNGDITAENFPLKGKGIAQVEWKLFHFDENIDSDDAKRRIKEDGWEVGGIEHLLAFGAKHPEEQRKYPVIALGSVASVYGYRFVAYLGEHDAGRDLDLGWWSGRWRRYCRFLAVRKVSVA